MTTQPRGKTLRGSSFLLVHSEDPEEDHLQYCSMVLCWSSHLNLNQSNSTQLTSPGKVTYGRYAIVEVVRGHTLLGDAETMTRKRFGE